MQESFEPPPLSNRRAPDDFSTDNSKRNVIILLVLAVVVVGAALYMAKVLLASRKPAAVKVLVQIGDSKARVIEVMGKPVGTTSAGNREILLYSQQRIVLAKDKVIAVEATTATSGEIKQNEQKIILMDGGKIQTQPAKPAQ